MISLTFDTVHEEYSSRIYATYLKYVAPEDIIVYSIDEVFIDVTNYLNTYGMTAHEMTMTSTTQASRQQPVSAQTCSLPRWPWTSLPRKLSLTKTAFALRNWTR